MNEELLYLKCAACYEVFEANEPHIARAHERACVTDNWGGSTGTYELLTEAQAF